MKLTKSNLCALFFSAWASFSAFGQNASQPTNDIPHLATGKFDLEASKKKLLKQFDANGNGKIDVSERKEYMRAIAVEKKDAQRKEMIERRQQPNPPPARRNFDPANEFIRMQEARKKAALTNEPSKSEGKEGGRNE